MSYDVYCIKNRAEKFVDFEHPTCKGKSLIIKLLPLQAYSFYLSIHPGRCPGLCAYWALPFRFAPATLGSARFFKVSPIQRLSIILHLITPHFG